MECDSCGFSCSDCDSSGKCFECGGNFYLLDNECVEVMSCPSATFLNSTSKACENCYSSCLSCLGPYRDQCTDCSEEYLDIENGYGSCWSVLCTEGQYFNGTLCLDCNNTCAACDSLEVCTKCKSGFTSVFQNNTLLCTKCSNGYKTSSDNTCKGSTLLT